MRKKSKKSTGDQKGHKGHTLKAVDHSDNIQNLKPGFCQLCGHSFLERELSYVSKKQVFDITPLQLFFILQNFVNLQGNVFMIIFKKLIILKT